MRYFLLFLMMFTLANGDEFDLFDKIDDEQSSFEEKENILDTRMKLSYQKNEQSSDDKKLYLNLGKHEKNYLFDIRIIADEDNQNINLKEFYYKGKFTENNFYEIGRINVKEGISRGYNPTDYFKISTSLTLSSDPKERKDNRLGSLAFRDTIFLENFTIKGVYAPKISVDKDTIFSDKKYIGLHLDETNYQNRASLYVDYSGFKDISSSVILHLDEDNLNFGLNLSYVYQEFIFYLENSSKRGKNDINKAMNKIETNQNIYNSFYEKKSYINQSTFGVNFTSDANIVTTVEYIFNNGGLDSDGWNKWFALSKQNPMFAGQLGAIRGELIKSEAIISKHSLFLLSRASDIWTNLDTSLLAWISPNDGSSLSQIGVEYAYNDSLQTNLYLKNYRGKNESEYGNAQNNYEVLIEAEYFF